MMDASGIKDETGNVETIIPFVLISNRFPVIKEDMSS